MSTIARVAATTKNTCNNNNNSNNNNNNNSNSNNNDSNNNSSCNNSNNNSSINNSDSNNNNRYSSNSITSSRHKTSGADIDCRIGSGKKGALCVTRDACSTEIRGASKLIVHWSCILSMVQNFDKVHKYQSKYGQYWVFDMLQKYIKFWMIMGNYPRFTFRVQFTRPKIIYGSRNVLWSILL